MTHPRRVVVCPDCGEEDLQKFRVKEKRPDGSDRYRTKCRLCTNKDNREWLAKAKSKETRRNYNRLTKYGLTPEDFQDLVLSQDSKCRICLKDLDSTCHIDHCHKTGKVRGVLCPTCNRALGLLRDDITIIESAARYLYEASCL